MNRRFIVPFFSVLFYFAIYGLIILLKPPSHDQIRQMHLATSDPLRHLADLQEFRLVPIGQVQQRTDKSLASRDEDNQTLQMNEMRTIDTRLEWKGVKAENEQIWIQPQSQSEQYILLEKNHYPCQLLNNSMNWKAISQRQCSLISKTKYSVACKLQKGLAKHFSLRSTSTNTSIEGDEWKNVFFLYAITANALNHLLLPNLTFTTSSLSLDSQVNIHLTAIKRAIQDSDLSHYVKYFKYLKGREAQLAEFQAIISRIAPEVNSICKLFVLDHFAALRVQLEIIYGMKVSPTVKQMLRVLRLFYGLSQSLTVFYEGYTEGVAVEHMDSWLNQVEFYYFLLGTAVVFVYLLCQVNIKQKVSRQFRHSFPPSSRFKFE